MAYSDYCGTLGAAFDLVNDIDVSVRTPSGTILYPNGLSWPDDLNNVEMIEFAPNESGLYSVEVSGRNVPMGDTQPYALVVRGRDTGATNGLSVSPLAAFVPAGPHGGPFSNT